MPGWTSTLQALPAGQTFADLYKAADGKLADEVVNVFANQLRASTVAAQNAFLEIVAEQVTNGVERATLIARLNNPGNGTVPLQVRVRRDLLSQLDARAEEEGMTRSDVVREALELSLARYKIRGGLRHPLFHYRWTDHPGIPTASWEQVRGTPREIRSHRAELLAKLGATASFDGALYFERRPVALWTVIGADGRTDETRWNRVRPADIDGVLIDLETEPGITVCCS